MTVAPGGTHAVSGFALRLFAASCAPLTVTWNDVPVPSHLLLQIMVANVRCEDIKNEQLAAFTADQAWASLVADAEAGLVRDFGVRAAGLKDSCLGG